VHGPSPFFRSAARGSGRRCEDLAGGMRTLFFESVTAPSLLFFFLFSIVSDYVCNRRHEDGDTPSPRLRFDFGRASNLCFLRSAPMVPLAPTQHSRPPEDELWVNRPSDNHEAREVVKQKTTPTCCNISIQLYLVLDVNI
jgi:hypothetical protein